MLAQEQVVRIEKYTVENGLSHNSVSGITKDKNGFLWISTYAGLDRFDGYSFKNYTCKLTPGIDLYAYNDIKADKDGNIWACAFSSFIFRYNDSLDRFETYTVTNKIPGYTLYKFFFDKRNNLWLASAAGILYLKSGDDPKNLRHLDFGNTFIDSLKIRTVAEDKSGNIWLGSDQGLFRVNRYGDSISGISGYRFAGADFRLNNENMVYTMSIDENDQLWAGMQKRGMRELDLNKIHSGNNKDLLQYTQFKRTSIMTGTISCDTILSIEPGQSGKLFVRTCKGIDLFDTRSRTSIKLCDEGASRLNDLDEGKVTNALYYSDEGILWIGSHEGLFKVTFGKSNFSTINNFKPDPNGTQPFKTSQVLADRYGRLWIGTQGNGLHLGLPDGNGNYKFSQFLRNNSDSNRAFLNCLYANNIYCLSETGKGKIWVSAGFFQHALGKGSEVEFINPCSETLPSNYYKSSGDANQILEIDGKLWVIYQQNGIKVYDTTTWSGKELYLNENLGRIFYPYVADADEEGILIRSETGLFRVSRKLKSVGNSYIPMNNDTLIDFRENYIAFPRGKFIITKADDGLWFWFPSISKGVTRYFLPSVYKTGKILQFTGRYSTENGLSNNSVYEIIEDKNGHIWISTLNGLNKLDPVTGLIRSFFVSDGLSDNRFNYGAASDRNGFIYFCNASGVVRVHPDSIKIRSVLRRTFITRALLNGKNIREFDKLNISPADFMINSLHLRYYQNSLAFEFAAIDYFDNKQIRYRYKMDGLNTGWIDAGTRRFAEYQDIRPGEYVFRVNTSENDGSWSKNEALITIEIIPPFWKRLWFYSLILAFVSAAVVYYIKSREKRMRIRNLWLEGQVREKTDLAVKQRIEIDQMKSRFYTNISHEFRTPLTLIKSSAREIEKDTEGRRRSNLTMTILSASDRLLKLVNELLDLSKIEAGRLELKASEGNIAEEIKIVGQTYLSDAERRGIKYSFSSDPEVINGWFDKEFIRKIMHNLISNALKFTQRGGMIKVELRYLNSNSVNNTVPLPYVEIIVRDSGNGISEEHLSRIFERFYQADNSNIRDYEGTGIGLSIVNELVKRHYGEIRVESKPGEGSVFTINFPIGKGHLNTSEIQSGHLKQEEVDGILPRESYESVKHKDYGMIDPEKPLVLIAEDNDDLRNFLSDQLSKDFRITEAANGKEAVERAKESDPDIIVSDVMMPVMDGVELCSAIKNDVVTCHVPVILLTAKADIESKLEGLRTGADDYITKPFNEEELIVRIKNLLMLRNILREKFLSSPLTELPELHNNLNDKSLLSSLIRIVESSLSDSSLSIEGLADKMNMSKRTLQRKIKALYGLTPVDFIKIVRIKHAAAIIGSGKMTITEAAYKTGFNSLSYFTKVFREVMGISPSEYLNK